MKIINVGIMSFEEMREYTLKIARGEIVRRRSYPKIFFTSEEAFMAAVCKSEDAGFYHPDKEPEMALEDNKSTSIDVVKVPTKSLVNDYKILPTQWTRFKDHFFDELATVVGLDDDGGGVFITLKQCNDQTEKGTVTFDCDEVDDICNMLKEAKRVIELIERGN